jgi:type II secretory pathway pseudopilin PulG
LAVIAIITILVGLLLPAVFATREAARQTSCTSNQHNISLALLQYENSKHSFPGWRDFMEFGNDDKGAVKGQASWVTLILFHMEQTALYDQLRNGQLNPSAGNSTKMPKLNLLLCPSRSDDDSQQERSTNYVVNGGAVDDFTADDTWWTLDTNAFNGVFLDRAYLSKENIPSSVSVADLSRLDGTSYTLLLSENVNRGFWISEDVTHFSCNRDGTALAPSTPDHLTSGHDKIEGSVAFCWAREYDPDKGGKPASYTPGKTVLPVRYLKFQRDCDLSLGDRVPRFLDMCRATETIYGEDWYQSARPSSNHPNMVIVTYCDGSTRALHEEINEMVFVRLMTGSDAQSDAKNEIGNTPFNPGDLD